MLKISNNIYTARFPISSSLQSSNNKLHQLTFKGNLIIRKVRNFYQINMSCYFNNCNFDADT